MINIDSNKVFRDGFRNDFTLEEFKDWVSKNNKIRKLDMKIGKIALLIDCILAIMFAMAAAALISMIIDYIPLSEEIEEMSLIIVIILCLVAAIAILLLLKGLRLPINFLIVKIAIGKPFEHKNTLQNMVNSIYIATDLSEINSVLHNYSLYRFMNSLDNKNNNDYKNITDDLKYSYMQAYQFIRHNGIQIQHYANTELDTELDKISEYNEQSSKQNDDDMNALMSNLTHGIRTDENTDYSDRVL